MGQPAVIWWVRRDLRLDDNPCLAAALATGGPVIPVAILDPETEALGAAPLWRWDEAVGAFARALEARSGRLILRRGAALRVLRALVAETGAGQVMWSRAYDPAAVARDTAVKAGLKADGIGAASHPGHLLFEPWSVETKEGGFYKVFTPMWKAVRGRDLPEPAAGPGRWPAPEGWPGSDRLADWGCGGRMRRGAAVVARYEPIGEAAALDRLGWFMDGPVAEYTEDRDRPDRDGTSRLSAHLSLGEIGPRRCWFAARAAMEAGGNGAETFLKELVWREFAYHLMWHTPRLLTGNWREEWDRFPWQTRATGAVRAWQRGRTGVPFVDAAMREMYVTGRMHNRARMIVASYLTKHLLTDWRIGRDWFEDCLVDWDPASNALGWQWTAGSGPDAAPYFRVFNPETQGEKFDPEGAYRCRWIAEGMSEPEQTALDYFEAVPRSWGLSPGDAYPEPVMALDEGRRRALAAYQGYRD